MTGDKNKKRVVGAGVLGLGLAGSKAVVDLTGRDAELLQQPNQVLVFTYDYSPGIPFQVVSRIQQETVNSILGRSVGEDGRQVVSDPQDYNGYIVLYQPGQDALGEYSLVFVREGTLATAETHRLTTDATFFNSEVNLLTAGLTSGDGEETPTEEEETTPAEEETPTEEEETTTPEEETPTEEAETTPADEETPTEEETTQEVVVETTTTTENGGGG